MTNEEIKQILLSTRTIASVGLSSSDEKESFHIVSYLQEQGYRIIPINPSKPEILGEKTYPSLESIPPEIKVDVVQLFRKSEDVPPFVESAIAIGAKVVWMQVGIENEDAAKKARAAGLQVVMNACMRVTHRMLIGPKLMNL